MREEEESNWFARWEEELPSPEELMPLSQSLITPDLAHAFDITSPNPNLTAGLHHHSKTANQHPSQTLLAASDFESTEYSGPAGAGSVGDETARTLKRPRLVWTPQLHKRFVDAVAHLGIKNAVPKTIMQLMNIDGLTRENVASHLQKYRLYLKRMQGLSSSASTSSCSMSAADAATEQLFASNPIPHPFLTRGASGPGKEPFMQFMPPPLLHHHQQMAAAAAVAQHQFYHQRQMGHFSLPVTTGGGFDTEFHTRGAPPIGTNRMGASGLGIGHPSHSAAPPKSYSEDVHSGLVGGRRVLTLFPTSSED